MNTRKLSRTAGTALMTLVLVALTIALEAFVPVAAMADFCPNAAERFGASANLPDCRAYELVTPMIKEDNDYIVGLRAFPDGEHVFIESLLPYPGAQNGQLTNALSTRTGSGWVTTPLTPPQGQGEPDELASGDNGGLSEVASFTGDFSAGFVNSPFASDPLDQDKGMDVYRVDIPGGASSLAALPDSGAMTEALINPPGIHVGFGVGTYLAGNSVDGSRVFFETTARLPTAPSTPADTHSSSNELYERHGDHTYLVGVLPDGSVPNCGVEIGNGGMSALNNQPPGDNGTIAPDGSNVVFRTPGYQSKCIEEGEHAGEALYLREDSGTPQARTVTLPGNKLEARPAADGSKIFTSGRNQSTNEQIIYEYDIPTGQTTIVGEGKILVFSADGSRVYYLSKGETNGAQLHLYEDGASKPILDASAAAHYAGRATGASVETTDGADDVSTTTPDGSKLLFLDRANLTAYDTGDPTCAVLNRLRAGPGSEDGRSNHCAEAYLYDAKNGSVTCVSCNPDGTPPVANVHLYQRAVAAYQAATTSSPFLPVEAQTLSNDGSRAFFETEEALVPQDTNGVYDAYEWENGHVYLLSSGRGSYGSFMVGVSGDGNDAFIQTTDNLLPQDVETSQQVYDARVGGGFPYTPPGHGCDSGQCQGPQTPAPVFAPPPSATFVGLGNPVREEAKPTPKRKPVKPKHRTPRKHKAKKAKKARSTGESGNFKRRGRK